VLSIKLSYHVIKLKARRSANLGFLTAGRKPHTPGYAMSEHSEDMGGGLPSGKP